MLINVFNSQRKIDLFSVYLLKHEEGLILFRNNFTGTGTIGALVSDGLNLNPGVAAR